MLLKRFSFVVMKIRKVTISDIANELNVSKTLVSLVLNGKGDDKAINKNTQKRVHNKAKELKYIPNQVARGLRMGKTKTIGLLVADISNPFFAKITRTIEHYAEKEGYSLIVCSSDEDQEREIKLIQMLINRQVDGIIMSSTLETPFPIEQLISDSFPFVLMDRYFDNLDANYVGVDNLEASKKAVEHLIKNGHRNIGLITLTPNYISSLKNRKQGFIEALSEAGIPMDAKFFLELDYNNLKNKKYSRIKKFITENKLSAIFTTNNNIAVGCIEVLREMNLKIPQDISLITFDDVELFKFTDPALSSISQPLEKIGKEAVSILLKQLSTGVLVNEKKTLKTSLIIRES